MKLPWIFPGLKKPNFYLYELRIRIPTEIPPNIINVLIFLIIFYIYIGGVYDVVKADELLSVGADSQGNPRLIYPGTDRQFLVEGIIAGLAMMLGTYGLYLMYDATKYFFDARVSLLRQFAGIAIVAFTTLTLLLMIQAKGVYGVILAFRTILLGT